jgi:hypothetical protein
MLARFLDSECPGLATQLDIQLIEQRLTHRAKSNSVSPGMIRDPYSTWELSDGRYDRDYNQGGRRLAIHTQHSTQSLHSTQRVDDSTVSAVNSWLLKNGLYHRPAAQRVSSAPSAGTEGIRSPAVASDTGTFEAAGDPYFTSQSHPLYVELETPIPLAHNPSHHTYLSNASQSQPELSVHHEVSPVNYSYSSHNLYPFDPSSSYVELSADIEREDEDMYGPGRTRRS